MAESSLWRWGLPGAPEGPRGCPPPARPVPLPAPSRCPTHEAPRSPGAHWQGRQRPSLAREHLRPQRWVENHEAPHPVSPRVLHQGPQLNPELVKEEEAVEHSSREEWGPVNTACRSRRPGPPLWMSLSMDPRSLTDWRPTSPALPGLTATLTQSWGKRRNPDSTKTGHLRTEVKSWKK